MEERIEYGGKLLAMIIRRESEFEEGSNFLTGPENPLQLGVLKHVAGYTIEPHVHRPVQRTITGTQEFLYVSKGRVLVDIYNRDGDKVKESELGTGDAVLLVSGGHSFRLLEDSQLIELKQGPYISKDVDKEIIE